MTWPERRQYSSGPRGNKTRKKGANGGTHPYCGGLKLLSVSQNMSTPSLILLCQVYDSVMDCLVSDMYYT